MNKPTNKTWEVFALGFLCGLCACGGISRIILAAKTKSEDAPKVLIPEFNAFYESASAIQTTCHS